MDNLELEKYFDRLWPICRSITGDGLRHSFNILQEIVPFELEEVRSGTQVFDWEIPREWNIKDAYIITPSGEKICNFQLNNLHVLNYSVPQNREMDLDELKKHLISREDLPDAVPYATSYYKENWGFCISYNQFKALPTEGKYKVFIDSTLANGSLTYGQVVLQGRSKKEILISSYLCHPSMANNELSGPLALASIYQKIAAIKDRKFSYRFVLAPETIGIIAFLHKYGTKLKEDLLAGYVLTCCADPGPITYKRSKMDTSVADRFAERVLTRSGIKHETIPFAIGGSDERQYCSPGFNLPVGSFMRTPYQKYKEYHTSLDNKELISFEALQEYCEVVFLTLATMEAGTFYTNTLPDCEPQLGKRGLYPTTGGTWGDVDLVHKMLHVLSYADGTLDLSEIATKRDLKATDLEEAVTKLTSAGLLKEV